MLVYLVHQHFYFLYRNGQWMVLEADYEKDRTNMKKHLLNPAGMFLTGLALGIIIRLLDLYTTNLGNIFSQLAVWILLGTIISIYSATPKAAMLHIFHIPVLYGDASDILRGSNCDKWRVS